MKSIAFALFLICGAAHADNANYTQCQDKLKKAQKLDVLYDLNWKSGRSPRVVVGPTFFKMPIDAKEGFVETVNCFLMGGESDKFITFEVLDFRTGNAVGKFSYGRLKMY